MLYWCSANCILHDVDNNWDHLWLVWCTVTTNWLKFNPADQTERDSLLSHCTSNTAYKCPSASRWGAGLKMRFHISHCCSDTFFQLCDFLIVEYICSRKIVVTTYHTPHTGQVKANMHSWHFVYRFGLKPTLCLEAFSVTFHWACSERKCSSFVFGPLILMKLLQCLSPLGVGSGTKWRLEDLKTLFPCRVRTNFPLPILPRAIWFCTR